jgi:uncharacterized integral membrane protein (TIGR00698 family)
LIGFLVVLTLAVLAWFLAKKVYAIELPFGIPGKTLEYPLWAAILGLVGNGLLRLFKIRELVRPGFRTELFLKIGLVLMGAGISLNLLITAAGGALVQGLVMITSVFLFTWWLSGVFKLDKKLRAVISMAISVCGVSAAIAAAGSVLAKKEHVTYAITLVILVALPMMVLAPLAAGWMGLPEEVAGAWFGGNIDTTAAVVGAGAIYGDRAEEIATIVKNTQNAMIGVVAFLLSLYFSMVVEQRKGERPSPRIIWDRFPKFILGFIAASILYSLGWIDGGKGTALDALKNWAFTLAFVCVGLEFSIGELKRLGWAPIAVFLIATVFNTLLALGVAWLIFGVILA